MKLTHKKIAVWSAALLAVAAVNGVRADETESKSDADLKGQPAEGQTSYTSKDYHTKATANIPGKCNRASGLIGMEVKNQNNERLGKIKDVVFDLNSERVAYVVMESPGKGFLREKYLAVPMSAFKSGADEKALILNADKSKVAMAEGFDRNNWPSANSPSWGAEPFWQSDTAAPVRSPEINQDTQPNNNNGTEYNRVPDKSDAPSAPDNNPTPQPAPEPKENNP